MSQDGEIRMPMTNRPRKIAGRRVLGVETTGKVIIDLVKVGMNHSRAAEAAHIDKSTLSKWISRGVEEQIRISEGGEPDEEEAPYLEFVENLMAAESESMAGLVVAWYKEGRAGDWKAAERFLAKRFPQEWGDSNTLKVEVSPFVSQVQIEQASKPVDDEARKRAILSALVEAGDLPNNVLEAWDKDEIVEAEVVGEHEENP